MFVWTNKTRNYDPFERWQTYMNCTGYVAEKVDVTEKLFGKQIILQYKAQLY